MPDTPLRRILAALVLMGLAHGAWAGGVFGLSPLRLNLSAQAPMGAFTLVNPAIVSLAPGERQVVRVALRAAPDRRAETGYRMLFTEVPQAGDSPSGASTVRIIKRMDVPVFVAPVDGAPRSAGAIAAQTTGDLLDLSFSNEGTGHWRLGDLKVLDATSGATLGPTTLVSVLPGGMRRLELRLGARRAPEKVVVEADVDGQPFRTELAVGRR